MLATGGEEVPTETRRVWLAVCYASAPAGCHPRAGPLSTPRAAERAVVFATFGAQEVHERRNVVLTQRLRALARARNGIVGECAPLDEERTAVTMGRDQRRSIVARIARGWGDRS